MSNEREQLPAIYKQAIKQYEQITKKKLDDPGLPKMTSVDSLVKEIEQQNNKFSEFRETKHLFFDILEGAMKPIELVGDLAAGAASMAFPPSSMVFGAVIYLIGAAKGVSASYDAIQDLLASLKNFTVRLRIYNRETISTELSDQLSEILVTLIEIFALSRKAIKGGRFLKFARNVLVGSDDQIKAAVGKLVNLTETEHRLVGAETLTETKRTGRVVDDVSVTVTATNLTVTDTGKAVGQMSLGVTELNEKVDNLMVAIDQKNDVEQDKGPEDNAKILLRPSITAQDWYDKINKSRVPGTGDWIRGEDLFKKWVEKDIPILWISGNPGAGKSYLSSNIITFLTDQYPQGITHPSHVSVGYFFFKDDNPKTRSFHHALCDLSYQISQNDPIYAKYLTNSCLSHDDIRTLTSAWRNLFVNFFMKKPGLQSSVYLVLDGVDEAFEEERKEFLELGKDILEGDSSRIQLVVVGRPHLSDSISEALENEVPTIHVTDVKNSADIIRYIETSIHKSSVLRRVSKTLRSEIVSKLSTGAQGMFIWVDLMLKELLRKRSETTIRKSLDEAPKGLKEMLRHVLESFSSTLVEDEPENLNELLSWVTCAQRPLTLGELDTVLKLMSPDGDGMIYLEGVLRKQFASFLNLTREDRLTTADLLSLNRVDIDSDEDQDHDGERGFDDVENVTDFDSAPTTTDVTFCHASIGDFFRDEHEGKVSAGDKFPLIGVDFNEAKFRVLRTCLRLFTDEEFAQKPRDSVQSLRPYVYHNWMGHLYALDPLAITTKQRSEIANLLATMLGQEAHMKRWAGNVDYSWFSDQNLKLIRKWLDDTEIQDLLAVESLEFIKSTSECPATVFKPVAMYIAKQWLEAIFWEPGNCCDIVYSYTCLEKGVPPPDSFGGFTDSFTEADEIISLAEWLSFDKTATWYRRVAITLRENSLYDEALEYFKKALELDSTMWLARAGMAIVHSMRKEWEKAIELDIVNEKYVKEKLEATSEDGPRASLATGLHTMQERMARNYEALGDIENSFTCYRNAHSNSLGCDGCTCKVLEIMRARGLYSEIIDFLKTMQSEMVPGKEYSRLTESLWLNKFEEESYFTIFADTARETDELEFILEAYRAAVREARKKLMSNTAIFLDLCLAKLYYLYSQEQDKAVRIWNKTIQTFTGSRGEKLIVYAKLEASTQLSRHAFREALDAGIGSPDAERYVKTLEKLAKTDGGPGADESTVIVPATSAVILGLWYRLNGRKEEANSYFKPSIKQALDILSDDDPDNDLQGFFELGSVLLAAGDFMNAIAIFHYFGGVNGGDGSEGNEGDSDEDDEDESFVCDGPCHVSRPNYETIHICKYCFDIGFCEDCIGLVKDGKISLNVCSPKHDWLYIPPAPEKCVPGKLLVDGVMMDMEDWKKMLRKEWKV